MTLSRHGHHIPLTNDEDEPPRSERKVMRCGGFHICTKCKEDFQAVLDRRKEEQMTQESDRFVRKQSNPVQAKQVTEDNIEDLAKWCGGSVASSDELMIPSMSGAIEYVPIGSYLIKDLNNGRFRGMDAPEFESQYMRDSYVKASNNYPVDGSSELTADAMRTLPDARALRNPEGNWPHPTNLDYLGRAATE